MLKKICLIAASLFGAQIAMADQCTVLTPKQARAALKQLSVGREILHWCEPCGDVEDHAVIGRGSVTTKDFGNEKIITIDGREQDIAYIFVKTGPINYTNLASLVGCPTHGVSTTKEFQSW